MNIGIYKVPLISTLLTTVYFVGIMASTSQLWMQNNWIVGITFFAGILAIYFSARSRQEVVVYIEKKKEDVTENAVVQDSQLDDDAIRAVVSDPQLVLNEICRKLNAGQGAIYIQEQGVLKLKYGYAVPNLQSSFEISEGLVGRVAAEGKCLYIDSLPEGYITVFSGLGNSTPTRLALIPIQSGVIEIATFTDINVSTLKHIEESCSEILK